MRGLSLADALDFTALVALRNRDRSRRMAARWLQRWLDETAGRDDRRRGDGRRLPRCARRPAP